MYNMLILTPFKHAYGMSRDSYSTNILKYIKIKGEK